MDNLSKLTKAVESAALDLAIQFEAESPVYRGTFKKSWDVDAEGSGNLIRIEIKNNDPIGRWKAIGRSPGRMPPDAPIRAWVLAKGINEKAVWAIRKKIADEGTDRWKNQTNVIGADRNNKIPMAKQKEYRNFLINKINKYLSNP